MHSPLGELWATKADLLPAIFKTGFVITVVIALVKLIIFLIQAKNDVLLAGPAAAVPMAAVAGPPASPSTPVVSVLAGTAKDSSSIDAAAALLNRIKRQQETGSPAVHPDANFDEILSQLETIRAQFQQKHEQQD